MLFLIPGLEKRTMGLANYQSGPVIFCIEGDDGTHNMNAGRSYHFFSNFVLITQVAIWIEGTTKLNLIPSQI